jgi:hypothetical protein
LASVLCLAASGWAVNITWTVSGTFDDGGTVYGTYVYDATANLYSSINVTTTAGSVLGGSYYSYLNPCCGDISNFLLFVTSNASDLTGTPVLSAYIAAPMTNNGGTIPFLIGGPFYSEESCADASCTGPAGPERYLVSGGVSAPTPEPGTLALVGSGLIGALGTMRRKFGV